MKKSLDKNALISIGQRIRELRNTAGLSREQLADKIGLSPEFVKSIELGKSMSLHTLCMICDTFDTSADFILFGKLDGSSNPIAALLEGQPHDVAQGAYKIARTYIETLKDITKT